MNSSRWFLLAGMALGTSVSAFGNRVMNRSGEDDVGLLPLSDALPVWYDNDDNRDTYSLEYSMVAASGGLIRLVGISTTTSTNALVNGVRYNQYVTEAVADAFQVDRDLEILAARRSGLVGFPDQVPLFKGNMEQGLGSTLDEMIDNTLSVDTPAGTAILDYISNPDNGISPDRPLLLCCGGQLTVAADIYIRDPSVADKVIVVWLGARSHDNKAYNGWADSWAGIVCAARLKICLFGIDVGAGHAATAPQTPKSWIGGELPVSPLTGLMFAKAHPQLGPPLFDMDGPPILMVMDPTYVTSVQRKSMGGTGVFEGKNVAVFKNDANGNIHVVTGVVADGGTQSYRKAYERAEAWGSLPTFGETMKDEFDRSDSAGLGPGWALAGGTPHIVAGNEARHLASGQELYLGTPRPAMFMDVVYPGVGPGAFHGQFVMASANEGHIDGYLFNEREGGLCRLQMWKEGVATDLLINLPVVPKNTLVRLGATAADLEGDGKVDDVRITVTYDGTLKAAFGYLNAPFTTGLAGIKSSGSPSAPARYGMVATGGLASADRPSEMPGSP